MQATKVVGKYKRPGQLGPCLVGHSACIEALQQERSFGQRHFCHDDLHMPPALMADLYAHTASEGLLGLSCKQSSKSQLGYQVAEPIILTKIDRFLKSSTGIHLTVNTYTFRQQYWKCLSHTLLLLLGPLDQVHGCNCSCCISLFPHQKFSQLAVLDLICFLVLTCAYIILVDCESVCQFLPCSVH